jgi:predicted nucleotidyltransferase
MREHPTVRLTTALGDGVTDSEHPRGPGPVLPQDLFAYLKAVVAVVSTAATPYCVIGAVALGAWGRPRATKDLDLLILADSQAREALVAGLSSSGIAVNEQWAEANPTAKGRVTRFSSLANQKYPLDVIYALDSQERATVERRRLIVLHGLSLWVASPEDLILLKLKAGRPTDFDDVMSIVKNPRLQLDLAYLWNWADRLGLQGELQYVLQAATPRT